MLIIPAIDLINGACVRLKEGDFNQKTEYNGDPLSIAKQFKQLGAKRIHIIDLDGAKSGHSSNRSIIKNISIQTGLQIQTGGGIRTDDDVKELIDSGIYRIILGTILVENINIAAKWIEKYGNMFYAAIDVRDGNIQTKGWLKNENVNAVDFGKKLFQLGLKTAIYTDVKRDGTLSGPNIEEAKEFSTKTGLRIIISGGIGSMHDLEETKTLIYYGLSGIIIGKAYYEGKIDLKKSIELYQDI